MPADALDRLFSEFSQVDNSITRRFGGSGLGLAITHRIAEARGGRVGVESQVGCGSSFWIEIPLIEAALPKVEASSPASEAPRRSLNILVAEDVPTNQLIIGATLRSLGHRFLMVASGGEALAQIERTSFGLVVLDM